MAATKVVGVFVLASLLMWSLPIGVLQAFNQNLIPGLENMTPQSKTLWSGGLAVLSVNFVIAIYVFLALREPHLAVPPNPDPAFVRRANATLARFAGSQLRSHPAEMSSRSESAGMSSRSGPAEMSGRSEPAEKSNKSD